MGLLSVRMRPDEPFVMLNLLAFKEQPMLMRTTRAVQYSLSSRSPTLDRGWPGRLERDVRSTPDR
jgi:hypothetical protein